MAERLSVGEVRVAPPAEAPGLPAEVAGLSIALGASEPARLHAAAPHGVTPLDAVSSDTGHSRRQRLR